MDNQQYVCGRDENPDTCFLCEQEGKDYCMICADGFTLEEYKQIQEEEQRNGGVWKFYKKYIVPIKTV